MSTCSDIQEFSLQLFGSELVNGLADTFKVLVRNDLSHWAERFLRMLDHPPGGADTLPLARAAGRR